MRQRHSSVIRPTQYPVRSTGAPAFPIAGGRPPLACAAATAITSMSLLIKFFALRAVAESVGRTAEADHSKPVLGGITTRSSCHDDHISRLQRLAGNSLIAQCSGTAPFDEPALHD